MKDLNKIKKDLRQRRVNRTRSKVSGNALKPRLAVFKGLRQLSIQAIDDVAGKTVASAYDKEVTAKTNMEKAKGVGLLIAKKLQEKKISQAVFDKRHYKYHGLVKEVADGAREGGLQF
ncbi:MAG: 50S ribosomal protein L18 [Patescibacteria group bacterium]|jgi:large subunit ribosomal protein L18